MAANWNLFGSFWARVIYWTVLLDGILQVWVMLLANSDFAAYSLICPFTTWWILLCLIPGCIEFLPSWLILKFLEKGIHSTLHFETFTPKHISLSWFLSLTSNLPLPAKMFYQIAWWPYPLTATKDTTTVKKRFSLSRSHVVLYQAE